MDDRIRETRYLEQHYQPDPSASEEEEQTRALHYIAYQVREIALELRQLNSNLSRFWR